MRVEAAPNVFRNEDRRQRPEDRRGTGEERRAEPYRGETNAKPNALPWFAPVFGAHLLGQIEPSRVSPNQVRSAYQQPESKTPRKPAFSQSA